MVYLFGGRAPFAANSVTVQTVLITYVCVGLAGGILVGLMRPLLKYRAGLYGAGLLVSIVLSVGITMSVKGVPSQWGLESWIAVAIVSVVLGIVAAQELGKQL
jgi:hypothetical protein